MITFLRRKKLGAGSTRGMCSWLEGSDMDMKMSNIKWTGEHSAICRNDKEVDVENTDYLVRWGCTSPTKMPMDKQLNISAAIHETGDKKGFREKLIEHAPHLVPRPDVFPVVVRPPTHAQGKNLWVAKDVAELASIVEANGLTSYYTGELIDKAAEFRVYIVSGRVVTVAEKTPENPDAVAWNVAQGGEFNVVSWGNWNLDVLQCAVDAFEFTSLDFGGVDVMVDKSGRPYLIEINSAPSLPPLADGRVSYRQSCMAKAFRYIEGNGEERMPLNHKHDGWRHYIHPAIWPKKGD